MKQALWPFVNFPNDSASQLPKQKRWMPGQPDHDRVGTYGYLPIHTVADSKYKLDPALLKLAGPLAS